MDREKDLDFLDPSPQEDALDTLRAINVKIAHDPNDWKLYEQKGRILLKLEELDDALEAWEAGKSVAPPEYRSIFFKNEAKLYTSQECFPEALAAIEIVLQLEPNDIELLCMKAEILVSQERYTEAKPIFELIHSLAPLESHALSQIALCCFQLKQVNEALETYDEAIALDPTNALLYTDKGFIFHQLQQYNEAIACYRKSVEFDPDQDKNFDTLAELLSIQGSYEEALQMAEIAINLNPNCLDYYLTKGEILQKLSRHEEALTAFDRILIQRPNIPFLYDRKHQSYLALNRYDDAQFMEVEKGLISDPTNLNLLREKAVYLRAKNNPDAVLSIFRHALSYQRKLVDQCLNDPNLKMDEGSPEQLAQQQQAIEKSVTLMATGYLLENEYLQTIRQYIPTKQAALEEIERGILICPDSPPFHETKGMILFQLEKYDEASQSFDLAVQYSSEDSHMKITYRLLRANCLVAAHHYPQALKEFDALVPLTVGEQRGECHAKKAMLYAFKLDQPEKAFPEIQLAMTFQPNKTQEYVSIRNDATEIFRKKFPFRPIPNDPVPIYEGGWKEIDEGGRSIRRVRHGYGKLIIPKVSIYEGEFFEDKRHGHGKEINLLTNEEYEGDWVAGFQEGKGTWKDQATASRYVGDFVQSQRHGRGRFEDGRTGEVYEGDWVKGKREGKGRCVTLTKITIVSPMKKPTSPGDSEEKKDHHHHHHHHHQHHQPSMMLPDYHRSSYEQEANENGNHPPAYGNHLDRDTVDDSASRDTCSVYGEEIYDGDWSNNFRDGEGVLIFANGDRYEGTFQMGAMQGTGRFIFANDGGIYEGEFKDNLRHGHGRFTFPAPAPAVETSSDPADADNNPLPPRIAPFYVGEWRLGRKEGQGHSLNSEGHAYRGTFHRDQREGEGEMIYANGDVYEGSWHDNMKHGTGRMIYATGEIYEGQWEKDRKHGHGIFKDLQQNVYNGDWQLNHRTGRGKCLYASGDTYIGEWSHDRRHGRGMYTLASGEVEARIYDKDNLVSATKASSCLIM
jgi:tetratricopeptide (TPR) repeat protein